MRAGCWRPISSGTSFVFQTDARGRKSGEKTRPSVPLRVSSLSLALRRTERGVDLPRIIPTRAGGRLRPLAPGPLCTPSVASALARSPTAHLGHTRHTPPPENSWPGRPRPRPGGPGPQCASAGQAPETFPPATREAITLARTAASLRLLGIGLPKPKPTGALPGWVVEGAPKGLTLPSHGRVPAGPSPHAG